MSSSTNAIRTPEILMSLGPPSAFTRARVKDRQKALNEHDGDGHLETGFFGLPPELRNLVYSFIYPHRLVDVNLTPDKVLQPATGRVSRQMRQESLDMFYGQGVWSHDLRGYRGDKWPQSWTPEDIFVNWITAIGDENAARIKRLRFYHHNFILLITVNDEQPRISYNFRTNKRGIGSASTEDGYGFPEAFRRAELRVASVVAQINHDVGGGLLTVHAVRILYAQIEAMKPSLCDIKDILGYEGAVYDESGQGGPFVRHLAACSECSYGRFGIKPLQRKVKRKTTTRVQAA